MGTIHLKKLEILGFTQEERDYNLGRVKYKFTAQCYIPCHSNKVDSTLLQECISAAAICSKCKSSIIRLQLWQDGSQKSGLDEYLGYKMCWMLYNIVKLRTSTRSDNRFSEINIRSVNAGVAMEMASVIWKELWPI